MKQDIKKLLGLQNVWVDSWEITEKEVVVHVRSPRRFCICPHCAESTKRVHQKHVRRIRHSVWQERTVWIFLRKRRFQCSACKAVFSEEIPGIDRRRSSENFRNMLAKELAKGSIRGTAKRTSISPSVLYDTLQERYDSYKIEWKKQGKNITLGIDEHSFRGRRMALTVTNITKRTLLGIYRDDSSVTVRDVLKNADTKRISEVCIDMKRGFLNAIREELPHARVTVDKFHVIAAANKMLDEVRSIIVGKGYHVRRALFKKKDRLTEKEQEKLERVFEKYKQFPSLIEAYFVKEKVHWFYGSRTMKEAKRRMRMLVLYCENSRSRYVRGFGNTLKRWKEYILNHFVNRSTNAFTEGVHTKIKMIKRMSFGFQNIEYYIAKIMLSFLPILWMSHHTIC